MTRKCAECKRPLSKHRTVRVCPRCVAEAKERRKAEVLIDEASGTLPNHYTADTSGVAWGTGQINLPQATQGSPGQKDRSPASSVAASQADK